MRRLKILLAGLNLEQNVLYLGLPSAPIIQKVSIKWDIIGKYISEIAVENVKQKQMWTKYYPLTFSPHI